MNNSWEGLWPVEKSIGTIMGEGFEHWINGWLLTLSKKLKSPVVFLYEKDITEKDIKDRFVIHEDFRRNSKGDTYKFGCELCKILKGDFCRVCDMEAANDIIKIIDGGKNNKYSLKTAKNGFKYYTYQCRKSHLTEWFIPLMVEDKFVGAFITGQFKAPSLDAAALARQLKDQVDKNIDEVIKLINNDCKNEPTKEEAAGFFEDVKIINNSLDRNYTEKCTSKIMNIQSILLSIMRDENGARSVPFEAEPLDIGDCFKAIRTDLAECLCIMKSLFGIKSVDLFKPSSSIEKMMTTNIKERIDAFNIENQDIYKKPLNYLEDLPKSLYHLDISNDEWKEFIENEGKKHLFSRVLDNKSEIKKLLTIDSGGLSEHAILILYAAKEAVNYPIGYLFSYEDEENFKNWGSCGNEIKKLLDNISELYLMRWQKVYSEYLQQMNEMVNRYVSHELSQQCMLLGLRYKEYAAFYKEAETERLKNPEINIRYSKIPPYIGEGDNFFFDMERYHKRISHIGRVAENSFSKLSLEKIEFGVHKSVLQDMKKRYRKEFKDQNHFMRLGKVIQPYGNDDLMRPRMYADPDKISEIVSNLMNNVGKYSHWGSNVELDARLSDDRSKYLITVVNYGKPIAKEDLEKRKIFKFGYRGAHSGAGIGGFGFGLYISNLFAEMHGGTLECTCELISKYNVPLLTQNLKILENEIKVPGTEKISAEVSRLRESGEIDRIVNPDILEDKNLLVFKVGNLINEPTARITFTLSIPHTEEG